MAKTEYKRDEKGNLIDPPVLPEFETRLLAAHNSGDNDAIARVQDEYSAARDKIAGKPAPKSNSNGAKSKSKNGGR